MKSIINDLDTIMNTVEVEIFFKGHKKQTSIDMIGDQKQTSIDMIGDQKQSVILSMSWLKHYNPEINWKTGEVKMTRCPDEYEKKWRVGKQMKPGWKKQEEKKEKKERRRPMIKEVKIIERIMKEKENEEEDLIELRVIDEIVPRQFHKYLKVFEKKDSERMPMRKIWNHAIDLKEEFVPKKDKIYSLSRIEREEIQKFVKNQLRKGYIRPLKLLQTSLVFFVPKKDGKKRMV